jgi:hypothetical protein
MSIAKEAKKRVFTKSSQVKKEQATASLKEIRQKKVNNIQIKLN